MSNFATASRIRDDICGGRLIAKIKFRGFANFLAKLYWGFQYLIRNFISHIGFDSSKKKKLVSFGFEALLCRLTIL